MPTGSTPTVRRRRLGAELRRLREGAGLTCDMVGEQLERAGSTISRIENGRVGIRARDVLDMLDLYDMGDKKTRDALAALARDSRKRGWWRTYGDVVSDPYGDYIGLESDAVSVRSYESQLVPGLLQTESYARVVAEAGQVRDTSGESERFVEVRLARQAVLTKDDPPDFWVILDEAVLRRPVGSPKTMREQLDRLVEAARLPTVTLQVLPFSAGAHTGIDGSFVVLEFPEPTDLDVVYLENLTSILYVEQPDEVRRYSLAFDHLRAAALSPPKSAALVAEVAKDDLH
ncbi:MAG: helix-turn-helix domain-containing protein [Streptosporangiaceae bacterium]